MNDVTYPIELNTDLKKLGAAINLLEQMRVEYNRQSALALKVSKADKFRQYGEVYRVKQETLLAEYRTLKQKIRLAAYTDKEWQELSFDEQEALDRTLYGDKATLQQTATLATSEALTELKTIDLDSLDSLAGSDPLEDFTTYTEVDSGADITVTSTKVDVSSMDRGADSHVSKSFGASHFGDFEHRFEVLISAQTGSAIHGHWGLANAASNLEDLIIANVGMAYYFTVNIHKIKDWENDASDQTTELSLSTLYYVTMSRSGTTTTARIHTTDYYGEPGSVEVDTLTYTSSSTAYQYVMVTLSRGSSSGSPTSFYTQNLDLQEAVAWVKNLSDSVAISDSIAKAFGQVQADTQGIADESGMGVGKVPSVEAIAIADAISKGVGLGKADTVAITDSFSRVVEYVRGFADTIGITDAIANAVAQVRTDTIAIGDAISKGVGKARADTIAIADSFSRVVAYVRALADTVGITDSISTAFSGGIAHILNLADRMLITDSISGVLETCTNLRRGVSRMAVNRLAASRMLINRCFRRKVI